MLQQMIKDACEDLGNEVRFRESYGGRGMYGRQCVGIVGQRADMTTVIAAVIKSLAAGIASAARSGDDLKLADAESQFEEYVDTLLDYSTDSMGHDSIYYWAELEPIAE